MIVALLGALGCRTPAPVSELISVQSAAPGGGAAVVVVAVHGLGDVPGSLLDLVRGCTARVRVVAPRGPIRHGEGFSWFETQFSEEGASASGADVAAASDRLAVLIDGIAQQRNTVGKPILTGFSQGGMLSFAVAVRHPESIAAAFPLAGALPTDLLPTAAPSGGGPPIRALHGDADPVLPIAPTRALVRQLDAQGWDATLRVFAGTEHAVPPAMHAQLCASISALVTPSPSP